MVLFYYDAEVFFLFVQAHTITEMYLTYTPSVVGYIFVENVLRNVKLTANLKKESAEILA